MKAILTLSAALLLHVPDTSDGFHSPPTVGALAADRQQQPRQKPLKKLPQATARYMSFTLSPGYPAGTQTGKS